MRFTKLIITLLFVIIGQVSFGQVYQLMPQYGYQAPRMAFDSTLQIPTFCGVPTLKSVQFATKKGAIAFDSCNNRFYQYNPKTQAWSEVSGGGGSTDTTSLSTRIDARVKYTDTASMLSNYLTFADTLPLSNRINQAYYSVSKLNDTTFSLTDFGGNSDTISMTPVATKLVTNVWNNSGATITKGSVIYINGAHSSTLPTIALAIANTEEKSAYTYGIVQTDIADNSQGVVVQMGKIEGLSLPTSSFTDGQMLYLSPTIAGGYTTTKPVAPYHYVSLGTITRAHPNNGSIQVKIISGFQLDELSDVSIPLVPADSVLLQFSRVDSLWHDVTITNAIGSRYLKPTDTASLSSRINLKFNTSDTSNLQQKSLPANSIVGNATYQQANAQSIYFKDTSGTYSGTITWTGTTAPSGTTSHTYRWTRIGSLVSLNISLVFQTAGSGLTGVVIALPSDAPTPIEPTGLTSASNPMYVSTIGTFQTLTGGTLGNAPRSLFRNNSGNNGYEMVSNFTGSTIIGVVINVQYNAQ